MGSNNGNRRTSKFNYLIGYVLLMLVAVFVIFRNGFTTKLRVDQILIDLQR